MNARPATYDRADQARKAMLAKVHLAKKELRLDDPTYRAALELATGKTSAGECSPAELGKVLDAFKARGWSGAVARQKAAPGKPLEQRRPRPADHPTAKKARALWISLHRLGVVRSAGEAALEAFAKRQLRVERLQWADQALAYKLIEALKAMAERAGWRQGDLHPEWSTDLSVRTLKARLIEAQFKALAELKVVEWRQGYGLVSWLLNRRLIPRRVGEGGLYHLDHAELDHASAELGRMIWTARAEAGGGDG